jgi:DUF1365 family protein
MEGRVMHKRLFPKINQFDYGIYYLSLDLKALDDLPIARNRFAPMAFYDCDHGARDGGDLNIWAREILYQNGMPDFDGTITLVTLPRIFGYAFNPVSYWLCRDIDGALVAYLCEVNNTFGETHTYLCRHDDGRTIASDDVLTGEKVFHVSPFLNRKGRYEFRLISTDNKFGSWINFFDDKGYKQLTTALTGDYKQLSKRRARALFWRYPMVTFKTIIMIHWQAVKLVMKGIKYIPKPKQIKNRITVTKDMR